MNSGVFHGNCSPHKCGIEGMCVGTLGGASLISEQSQTRAAACSSWKQQGSQRESQAVPVRDLLIHIVAPLKKNRDLKLGWQIYTVQVSARKKRQGKVRNQKVPRFGSCNGDTLLRSEWSERITAPNLYKRIDHMNAVCNFNNLPINTIVTSPQQSY